MRAALGVFAGVLTLVLSGCASSHHVRTMVAPEADVAAFQAFQLLPSPQPQLGLDRPGSYDTALTNQAVRATIAQTLRMRGYILDDEQPDFFVAVYTSRNWEFEVAAWGYGYPHWPQWDALPRYREQREPYAGGTVVVDLIAAQSKQLLWRGTGSAPMTLNPVHDTDRLRAVAKAVVERVPRARTPVVAAGQ